ncbi:hypothetical protein BS17DRAFT_76584 [Gyrodon lividus]|nr:hypothetical protein BS17DRAFT_76584 [Gyrodon lividus]
MLIVTRGELLGILAPVIRAITDEDIRVVLQDIDDNDEAVRHIYLEIGIKNLVKQRIQYAILSHRWFDDAEEPTLQNFSSRATKTLIGYKKLLMFCEKAQEYGCSLAWTDTCCIDKTSSSELDEAIHSMYRWYNNAYICIAYLAGSSSLSSFDEEVWFTRGWTLQELLAPDRIKFYGNGWMPISGSLNDKDDAAVLAALNRVTSIPQRDLQTFIRGPRDARKKLVWASTRRTSRIEDAAYSLIGLFDVSIPIAYGEGHRAFYRLMVEIIQVCYEWDIFLFSGPPSLYHRAFAESPRSYRPLPPSIAYTSQKRGDQWFSMSKRGLEMKLLMFHVQVVPASVGEFTDTHIVITNMEGIFDAKQVRLAKAISSADLGDVYRHAVGVVDFERVGRQSEGRLQEEQDYFAFLSRSRVDYEEWEQVETCETLYLHSNKDVTRKLVTVWIPLK